MQKFIQTIFDIPELETIRMPITNRYYDLLGPSNEILLPENWSLTIQPDWIISMVLWSVYHHEMEPPGDSVGQTNVAIESRPSAGIRVSIPTTSKRSARPINTFQQASLAQTPLHEAVLRGHKMLVELLLR